MEFYSVLYDDGLSNRCPMNLGNVKTLERAKEILKFYYQRFKLDLELGGFNYTEMRNPDDTYVVLMYNSHGEKHDTLWIFQDSLED